MPVNFFTLCLPVLRALPVVPASARLRGALLFAAVSLVAESALAAINYHARMDVASWRADSQVLGCRLVQDIPDFGRAVFEREAGGELRFFLHSPKQPLAPGQASLRAKAPAWHPQLEELDLGVVAVRDGVLPIQVDAAMAARLLAELYQGRAPAFLRRSWYADEMPIEVGLSPATFRLAHREYQRCLGQLAPVGFAKLERSRVHFASDRAEILPKTAAWLDIVADYLLRADDVERLYIDGHTDDTHTSTYNVELSRKRAEAVAGYLATKGVSRNLITIRFHGERYPVKPNTSLAGKAYNRRVTLRVERVPSQIAKR
ncbi:MAG: OmpA family protein [Pseudomonadales bacterium]|nr:OmpA family protein [Pseudomonadales bacterium]